MQWAIIAVLPAIDRELNLYPSAHKGDNRPVEMISWYDAEEFCKRLTNKTGRKYRLPSEAEWEYACRAATETPFYCGKTLNGTLANYNGQGLDKYPGSYGAGQAGKHRNETTAVGSFPANEFGLYDMHGNVWEWCLDNWHPNYQDAPTDGSPRSSKNQNSERILRGGSWWNPPGFCRSAYRHWHAPDLRAGYFGLRIVCSEH